MHELNLRFEGIQPPVWRRIAAPSRATLADLHAYLHTMLGWSGQEDWEFEIRGSLYGPPGERRANARKTRLEAIAPRPRVRMVYRYGAELEWELDVTVETITADPGEFNLVEGDRDIPPEDAGGPLGYADQNAD